MMYIISQCHFWKETGRSKTRNKLDLVTTIYLFIKFNFNMMHPSCLIKNPVLILSIKPQSLYNKILPICSILQSKAISFLLFLFSHAFIVYTASKVINPLKSNKHLFFFLRYLDTEWDNDVYHLIVTFLEGNWMKQNSQRTGPTVYLFIRLAGKQ